MSKGDSWIKNVDHYEEERNELNEMLIDLMDMRIDVSNSTHGLVFNSAGESPSTVANEYHKKLKEFINAK